LGIFNITEHKQTGDSIKCIVTKRDFLPTPEGIIACYAPTSCLFDHFSADIESGGTTASLNISLNKEACSASDIKEFSPFWESTHDRGAYMGMVASSPGLVIMVIICIGNGIVMLLDFLLP
jgi:hypothetical protein